MSARTFILDGLAQSDLDMNNFRLLNLDTSNLSISGLPPDVTPPAHNFLNGWIRGTQTWSYAQPGFSDLSGNLTSGQQLAITQLGTITTGVWQGTRLNANYVPTLENIQQPQGDVSMNTHNLKNVANPVDANDAVNLQTLQAVASGLQPKQAVAAATTADIVTDGLRVIDGYTLQSGDRVLVKDQATTRHYQNGIWVAAVGAWTRATDADTSAKLVGAFCNVLNGSTNGGTGWVQSTPSPINLVFPDNGTEPVFVLFTHGVEMITAGPGLQRVGNTIFALGTTNRIAIGKGIDIDAAYVGQSSITTLGTITTGSWLAGIIGASFGGTGHNNPGGISLIGNFGTELVGGPPNTYDLTFQLLNTTVLQLPTSGTVATLAGNETFTNKHIDASQIDTGVFSIARGGTGASNAVQAAKNLLPIQAGHAGQSLKTDGTNIYWG